MKNNRVYLTDNQRQELRETWRANLLSIGIDPDEKLPAQWARHSGIQLKHAGLPSLRQLARKYGIGICTASYIVRGIPPTGGRQRNLEKITHLSETSRRVFKGTSNIRVHTRTARE